MSKIICDICGTSYDETDQQCPICGCVRPGDVQRVTNEVKTEGDAATGYTYVKGGRFSKSNVRRRNKSKPLATAKAKQTNTKPAASDAKKEQKKAAPAKKEEKKSASLLITAILLLLAIIAVVIYIAVRFFGPTITPPVDPTTSTDPTTSSPSDPTTPSEILCTNIKLDVAEITFDQKGSGRLLNFSVEPADTTEKVTFRSEDETVATVSADGMITAVGKGQTKIIITCGSIVKECTIVCNIRDYLCTDIILDVSTVTFTEAGESKQLQVTLEPADTIDTLTFRSENEAVATVSADGKITAVAKGQTKIIVTCGSITKECAVICQIEEIVDPPKPAEEIRLNRSDITFSYEGESWIVYSGTVAKNLVTFTSDNEAIVTFVDGKAVAIGPGTTSVHAEYNGQKLSCIIRCVFESSQGGVGGNGGVGEDGDGKVTYDIYTQYGDRARDITISVNEKVYLYLKDSNGNKINVTWTSSSNACTVTDNLITGAVAWSNATVSTTYDGQTYSCIIRVVSSNG